MLERDVLGVSTDFGPGGQWSWMPRGFAIACLGFALGCAPPPEPTIDDDSGSESGTDESCELLPDREPLVGSCCGCTCADPLWSCSAETCFDENGQVTELAPEAGFIEVPSRTYRVAGVSVTSPRSRLWYVFQPARSRPEDRPLLVMFNGGPGAASELLLSANTAEQSIDPDDGHRFDNPSPWTEFANLLYVDAPTVGFSYALPSEDGSMPSVGHDPDAEAGAFLRVLFRFLARHDGLLDNEVVLVGESYGGTRASLMLRQLLEWERLEDTEGAYGDPALRDAIVEHFALRDPGECRLPTPDQIVAQFGYAALVQGWVAGSLQNESLPPPPHPSCPQALDIYDCARPQGFLDRYFEHIATVMRDPAELSAFVGVDVSTIEWMHASARRGAYGRDPGESTESAMEAVFGGLEAGDAYFMPFNPSVSWSGPENARNWQDPSLGEDFVAVSLRASFFMTDARRDQAVYTAGLPLALQQVPSVLEAAYLPDRPSDTARPGLIEMLVETPDGEQTVTIRAPRYDEAGHVATLDKSAEVLADLETWFEQVRAED